MRISRPILLTTTLVALSSAQAFSAPAPAPSATSAASRVPFIEGRPFAEILRKAKTEKPIMVDVYAVWCGPCKLMDAKTFAHPAIADWASKKLVSVKIDAEKGEGRKIARRYSVGSFPTVLFLDSDGNELDRLQGAFDPDPFRAGAEKILSGQSSLTTALAQLDQSFTPEQAAPLVGALAGRNDLRRMRPLVYRILDEDPDLGNASTIEALLMLVGFEDYSDKLSAETADYVQTYLPKLRKDPRRGLLIMALAKSSPAVAISRAYGFWCPTRSPPSKQSSFLPDILAARFSPREGGRSERRARHGEEATEVVATVSPSTTPTRTDASTSPRSTRSRASPTGQGRARGRARTSSDSAT
jgi:thiol-disulfide isomerase/thioredoxin